MNRGKHNSYGQLIGFIIFIWLALSPTAQASRIVFFDVTGTSQSFNQDEDATIIYAGCYVTVTNSGTTSQSITGQLAGTTTSVTATSTNPASAAQVANFIGAGKDGSIYLDAFTNSTNAIYVVPAAQRAMFVWLFPTLPPNTIARQEIRCKGSITVEDTDPTQPGFLTANGVILTWTQSARAVRGGASLKAIMNQIKTPFEIGEGRPF